MRWLLSLIWIVSATFAGAQTFTGPQTSTELQTASSPQPEAAPSQISPATLPSVPAALPDAPGAAQPQQDVVAVAETSFKKDGDGARICGMFTSMKLIYLDPSRVNQVPKPCGELIYPYQRFLTTNISIPMTWQQKGYLALHDLTDPANLGTIVGVSAITYAIDMPPAYGSGWSAFGKLAGVSLLQDATEQFFGTFAIPALARQDPRYYRMPHASIPRRVIYSISRTAIARGDDGNAMPNYGTLLSYPINAELSNLYVPGIHTDAASTIARIATGLVTDPANNLLSEFLPDVASHIHIRIIFVQRIINGVAAPESMQ